jgi:hypothetical protein
MLKEIITVYCETHMKHTNTLCVKAGDTYSNHWALKSYAPQHEDMVGDI